MEKPISSTRRDDFSSLLSLLIECLVSFSAFILLSFIVFYIAFFRYHRIRRFFRYERPWISRHPDLQRAGFRSKDSMQFFYCYYVVI